MTKRELVLSDRCTSARLLPIVDDLFSDAAQSATRGSAYRPTGLQKSLPRAITHDQRRRGDRSSPLRPKAMPIRDHSPHGDHSL